MSLCCFPNIGYDPYNGSALSYTKNVSETAPERELGIKYPGQPKERTKGKFPGQVGMVQGIPLPTSGEDPSENGRASVMVPPRTYVGDTIQISIPDGRTLEATVPPMCGPGSSFIVEIPPVTSVLPVEKKQVQKGNQVPSVSASSQLMSHPTENLPIATTVPINSGCNPATQASGTSYTQQNSVSHTPSFGQNIHHVSILPQPTLLQVRVPIGTSPGTTLHIKVPGDGRVVAAVVPPGVTQFNVSVPPISQVGIDYQQSYEEIMGYSQNHNINQYQSNGESAHFSNDQYQNSSQAHNCISGQHEAYQLNKNNDEQRQSTAQGQYFNNRQEQEYEKIQHFKYQQQQMYETTQSYENSCLQNNGGKSDGYKSSEKNEESQQKHSMGRISPWMAGPALMGGILVGSFTDNDKSSRK